MISPFRRFSARPARGLYDAQHEHDACGVAFVADHARRAAATTSSSTPSPPCATSTTAAPSAPSPDTGDGAGILDPGPGRVPAATSSTSSCPRRARTRSASPSCPTTTSEAAGPRSRLEAIAAEEGLRGPRLARRARRRPDLVGATARACHAAHRAAVRRRRPAAARGRAAACASSGWRSACASGPSARPAVYFPSLSARTLVYKGMLTTGAARAVLPRPDRPRGSRPRSRWCTPGSPRTRSRPGRSRTRSGSSPTTARSTRSGATATGCAPARPARQRR